MYFRKSIINQGPLPDPFILDLELKEHYNGAQNDRTNN